MLSDIPLEAEIPENLKRNVLDLILEKMMESKTLICRNFRRNFESLGGKILSHHRLM